jgi:flagellar motility protein MotE (MotC chaperone)
MKFIQTPLFAALLGGVLFLITSAFITTQGLATAPHANEHENEASHSHTQGASWDFFNPELDQIVSDLKAERDALAAREKQLGELEARLRAERAELDGALKNIKTLQQQVDREVFRIKEDEAGNLKKLAKMYAAMEPAGAAKILRELDDVVLVKILTLVKEAEAASILDSFARLSDTETKRAAILSEHLRATSGAKPSTPPAPK